MRPRDPRIRQRINQISHNLESANESAQEGLYTFSQNYLTPCLASIGNCVQACTAPCLPSREDQLRRRRRGRAEANFDFYDDWDDEQGEESLLGWGTGELDRLLAGSGLARGGVGGVAEQPRRPRKMSYGTRQTRRRSTVHIPDNRADPTVIPSSSLIGFLERFPWRFGAKGVKYWPSVADLQEHPGSHRRHTEEDEPLMEAAEDDGDYVSYQNNGRGRSGTQSSRGTSNSLSSGAICSQVTRKKMQFRWMMNLRWSLDGETRGWNRMISLVQSPRWSDRHRERQVWPTHRPRNPSGRKRSAHRPRQP